MSDELTKKFVEAKTVELTKQIASKTGVAEGDVAKVMSHLGLSSALANRLNVAAIRVSAGMPPI
jgi:predicted molibdopterin-dependent oxidoreductase YjgC